MKSFAITVGRGVQLDASKLVDGCALIQGTRGSGKSYLARVIVEQTIDEGLQTIVLDPEGEFVTLREKYDVIIAGKGGDVPCETRSAKLLARRIAETGASTVVDLSDLDLEDRRAFVRIFLDTLDSLPKRLERARIVVLDEAHKYCLDRETEILTAKGWRRYTDLRRGLHVVAFDPDTAEYRIEPVRDVLTYHYDGEMVSIETRGVSMLATPEHRVVIRRNQRAKGRRKKYGWTFCRAAQLPQQIEIPLGGAPCGEGVDRLSLDLLRVLGWVLTDGYNAGGKVGIGITQSVVTKKMGRHMVTEMKRVLPRVFDSVSVYERDRGGPERKRNPEVDFYIGKKGKTLILRALRVRRGNLQRGNRRRIPRYIIERCSREQLAALYQGLMEGDGSATGSAFFPGKSEGLADDFQEIALRLGICALKRWVPSVKQWHVHIAQKRASHHVRKAERVRYCGPVWDITVPSGAFVVRRHGRVYVTGNCPEAGKGKSQATEAVVTLMSQGRKRGIGAILVTQRLSKLRKDAAAEAANIFIGRTSPIDLGRAQDVLGCMAKDREKLRSLEPGEFYADGPGLSKRGVVAFKSSRAKTSHPQPGSRHRMSTPPPRKVISKLLKEFSTLPPSKEAEETASAEEAKAEVRRLKRELAKTGTIDGQVMQGAIEAARADEQAAGERMLVELDEKWRELWIARRDAIQEATGKTVPVFLDEVFVKKTKGQPARGFKRSIPVVPDPPTRIEHVDLRNGKVPGGKFRSMLTALAQHGELTRKQLGLHVGMSAKGGGFNNYLGLGKKLGLWVIDGGTIAVTDAGFGEAGDFELLPTGAALVEHWCQHQKVTGKAKDILRLVVEAGEAGIDRETLADAVEMSASGGGFNNYLGVLRTLDLISRTAPFVAAKELR